MTVTAARVGSLDIARIRAEYPVLRSQINGYPLAYLDNAATSQKPRVVVEAEADFALLATANIHRGVHTLSQRATAAFEAVREDVRRFIHAREAAEVVFTSGTTAALNLVAQSYARSVLRPGDEILLTEMEHHSNIVPWQLVAGPLGAKIRAIPLTDEGELDLDAAAALIGPRTRIVGVAHVSNVLGTVNPVRLLADQAHAVGASVVVDGAQAVPHLKVDVGELGADFYVASAHKMYGPTGVGFVYGRRELMEAMPPWQGGGGMIQSVGFDGTSFAPIPARFEAGTPPISQVVGLGAAIRYLEAMDWASVAEHEAELLRYASELLAGLPGVRMVGAARERVGVLSFVVEGIHPHDVGTILDLQGVAVRASHHCAQPLMRRYGIPGTVRAAFALYNTGDEVDRLVAGVREAQRVFAG